MMNRKLLRTLIVSLCATTGAIVACSHDERRAAGTLPPTGESTAPGPADPTVPPPDSVGPQLSSDPAAARSAPSSRRVAEASPTDAGVPRGSDAGPGRPIGGGDGGIAGGSGLGSGLGSGSAMPVPNQPPPGAPIPNQPAPGTPPAPHR